MKLSLFICTAILLPQAIQVTAQSGQSLPSDGLELLQKVAQHYADARQYWIESTEERTISNDYVRQWTKTVAVAAEEQGGRTHFEGRTQLGDAAEISDGLTIWKYHATQHRYTAKPVVEGPAVTKPGPVSLSEMGSMRAKNLRKSLAASAERFNSAERLPDAVLVVDDRRHYCAVVHIGRSDLKRTGPEEKFEQSIWIDKSTSTILKVVERSSGTLNGIAQDDQVTTLYTHTVLDSPLPKSLFAFSPPPDAHQVIAFPSPMEEPFGATLIGDRVPALKLKAADGTVTPIESFRGKTVLIDLWATWCAPCVAALPALAKLAEEGKEKGLVLIAVDRDEDPNKAAAYLKEKGLALTNFHDGDGQIESMLGPSPLPRDLIIDRVGRVVVDAQLDENRLRSRLAELEPAFKDFAPKAQANPCVASK
jgi:thiol-disulfide isomerase/thioredoxin